MEGSPPQTPISLCGRRPFSQGEPVSLTTPRQPSELLPALRGLLQQDPLVCSMSADTSTQRDGQPVRGARPDRRLQRLSPIPAAPRLPASHTFKARTGVGKPPGDPWVQGRLCIPSNCAPKPGPRPAKLHHQDFRQGQPCTLAKLTSRRSHEASKVHPCSWEAFTSPSCVPGMTLGAGGWQADTDAQGTGQGKSQRPQWRCRCRVQGVDEVHQAGKG